MKNPSLSKHPFPLESAEDLDPLLDHIGDSNIVLLGEASHGTNEYYTWRAKISQRLIKEKGFSFIAVEGDWPDSYRINEWIKHRDPRSIIEVLSTIKEWPAWMWANWEVAALATWLKNFNKNRNQPDQIGFYGLDVYSLWESMDIISEFLEKEDPSTARLARKAIACFEPFRTSGEYRPVFESSKPGCQEKVINLLQEVKKQSHQYNHHPEAALDAEVNAMVLANAEKYYRSLTEFGEHSWNIRDRHMIEVLHHLLQHHQSSPAKAIVWAHNSHIGDARATDMAASGLINLGQLAREKYGTENVKLIGFGSYQGDVIAGRSWGAPMRKMKVPKAKEGSLENLLYEKNKNDQLLIFEKDPSAKGGENAPYRLSECTIDHRAIGVVYNPKRESGNYVPSQMTKRYDAFLFIAESTALHPLPSGSRKPKPPENYPFGI